MSLERGIKILIALNAVLVALLAGGLFFNLWNTTPGHPAQAGLPTPTASSGTMQMGLAHIPTNSDCVLCHEGGGGSAGLKVVPGILHPVEGWRRCTVCHTDSTLGRLAPGHNGITEEECLNCHKTGQSGPAITQPHAALANQDCLSCHGTVAHLPSSMASSDASDCILCHKPADLPPPQFPHSTDPALGCRACHQGEQVGGLPISHALRSDRTCLLCHDIVTAGGATFPPSSAVPSPDTQSLLSPTRYPLELHSS
jgi:cytochrome c554/c'-like protein